VFIVPVGNVVASDLSRTPLIHISNVRVPSQVKTTWFQRVTSGVAFDAIVLKPPTFASMTHLPDWSDMLNCTSAAAEFFPNSFPDCVEFAGSVHTSSVPPVCADQSSVKRSTNDDEIEPAK
jgi:hypothetical protein